MDEETKAYLNKCYEEEREYELKESNKNKILENMLRIISKNYVRLLNTLVCKLQKLFFPVSFCRI